LKEGDPASVSSAGWVDASHVQWPLDEIETMTEKNATVLITGGTDGLGKAAALLLARRGYRVFAAGRSPSKRQELEHIAQEERLPLHTLEMDVTDNASVAIGVELVLEKGGGIEVLINNAGLGYLAVVEELRLEDFRRQFEVNLFGVVRVTQAVLPHMRARRKGRILMMSSVAGLVSPPTYGAYSSSKHALEGLSNSLRLELYPFGIDVILIEPGYIITNFQQIAKELAQSYSKMAKTSPYAQIYASAAAGSDRGRASSKTTPENCAQVILQAIESPHPKARYPVTPMAKWASFGKRILPDTLFDSILRKRFGITRVN
jgi:NAD(P)-dependent dehydrogenase (short-subunit alcohol dehydrogenase family)